MTQNGYRSVVSWSEICCHSSRRLNPKKFRGLRGEFTCPDGINGIVFWERVMEWTPYMESARAYLPMCTFLVGIVMGWVIWGGRRQYVPDPENGPGMRTYPADPAVEADNPGISGSRRDDGETRRRPHRDHVPEGAGAPAGPGGPQRPAIGKENQKGFQPAVTMMAPTAETQTGNENQTRGSNHGGLGDVMGGGVSGHDKPGPLRVATLLSLSEELDAIRTLIRTGIPDTESMKEQLDRADHAIKRANGRAALILDQNRPG